MVNYKKYICLFVFYLYISNTISAQYKQDYVWLYGVNTRMEINFNNNSVALNPRQNAFSIDSANASICDDDGQLLLYSNGCNIANGEDEIIINGDSINQGEGLYNEDCGNGQSGVQDILLLPWPKDSSKYILLHKPINELTSQEYSTLLMYSVIEKTEGIEEVIVKNQIYHEGIFLRYYLTAINHRNGIDWWIIQPSKDTNIYNIFLFDSSGIKLTHEQEIGNVYSEGASASGTARFSPDGKMYATYNYQDELQLFDFDRETGLLSNHRHLIVDESEELAFSSVEWSSNSRFIYCATTYRLYQIDTWAENLEEGTELIATWSGLSDPFANVYFLMALAPDCRIYMRSTGGSKSFHVVHYPDRKGEACGFVEASFPLPADGGFANWPNHPRWRVDQEMKCDSSILTMFGKPVYYQEELDLYPNPTRDRVRVQLPTTYDVGQLNVYDMEGRLVLEKSILQAGEKELDLDIQGLEAGTYMVEWLPSDNRERKVWIGRMIVL